VIMGVGIEGEGYGSRPPMALARLKQIERPCFFAAVVAFVPKDPADGAPPLPLPSVSLIDRLSCESSSLSFVNVTSISGYRSSENDS